MKGDRYRDRVARFATGRIGDAEKAEDVTSETFEAVCRNLGAYREGTDFEAWLFTIAHRRVAVLAGLPALGGGLLWWAGERGRAPSVVRAPGDPGAAEQDPPAADGRDRKDAGSGRSGRSGAGGSGGGGSGGPG
jgi:hypothetical protein